MTDIGFSFFFFFFLSVRCNLFVSLEHAYINKIEITFFPMDTGIVDTLPKCFPTFYVSACFDLSSLRSLDLFFPFFFVLCQSSIAVFSPSVQSPRAHLQVVGMLQFMFLTYTNRACPLLFLLFLCLFLSLCPFQLHFIS